MGSGLKLPLHLSVECLMATREPPVELTDMDGIRSAEAAGDAYPIGIIQCLKSPALRGFISQSPVD